MRALKGTATPQAYPVRPGPMAVREGSVDEQPIDLLVEALTGAVYDLCVSPFETILGIKMTIQRLEGIPVYQQRLVYKDAELQDEFCLEEYGIDSGAQLKLLVAMRGGPVHAHRLPLEDPTLLELTDFFEVCTPARTPEHRYAVMLLREEELKYLHMQTEEQDPASHCSPAAFTNSLHKLTPATKSESVFAEHALTKGKMKTLQLRLRNRRHQDKFQPAKLLVLNSSQKQTALPPSSLTNTTTPTTPGNNHAHHHHCHHHHNNNHNHHHHHMVQRKLLFSSGKSPPSPSAPTTPHTQSDRAAVGVGVGVGVGGVGVVRRAEETPTLNRRCHSRSLRNVESTKMAKSETLKSQLHLPKLPTTSVKQNTTVAKPPAVTETSSCHLPPLGPPPPHTLTQQETRRNRCMQCRRKTGLATTYTCRCGGLFCALHRYAEAHYCTYDYKTSGKQIIAQNNPLVTAPKLPKL